MKAKARKAVVLSQSTSGETCVTSIRVNGGGSYGRALMNQGYSNGTAPKKDRLLCGQPYGFQNAIECHETETNSQRRTTQLSLPILRTGLEKGCGKSDQMAYLVDDLRSSKSSPKKTRIQEARQDACM